jgi:transposase
VTCWRRLCDWQQAGVWEQLHHRLLDWLGDEARSTGPGPPSTRSVSGPGVGELTGANPVDGAKSGSEYHLLIDAIGIPLAVGLSAANSHDSQLLEQLVDAVLSIIGPRGRPGRPRKRPVKLHADKGYDFPGCRRALRRRGISPRIARRGVESSQRLGRHRWKVERSLAWLLANRRLTIRYERRADILTAFLHLACVLICARKLGSP